MIRYLIKRPVAVFSISFALLILGWVAMQRIPVSLMPQVDIPRIAIQVNYPGHSAEEMENIIVKPLRNALAQTTHLNEMQTQTQDGKALLQLYFDFGTRTDYAFLEVNEKLDAAIDRLPKDLQRPKVIKATTGDIPVFNLLLTGKHTRSSDDFLAVSEFAREIVKKRIEQIPEVAIADISGDALPEIRLQIKPGFSRQLQPDFITKIIKQHNLAPGNLVIKNGIYLYHLKFSKFLNSLDDLKKIPVNLHGKLFNLGDLVSIEMLPRQEKGNIFINGKKAVSFLVIKQADAKISHLKNQIYRLTKQLSQDYPNLQFHLEQDQSKLIDISLNNLKTSLFLGTFLAILILFFFSKDFLSPVIVGISIPVSLVISMLFLHLLHISLNIISLSGLILGVGMMIDNAIIVIDNIQRKLQTEPDLDTAVSKGTNEIIAPLITSMLTTISVFLPLVYLSGISGALFYDQAVSVSVGLTASLLVSILIIPVLYRFLYRFKKTKPKNNTGGSELERTYLKSHAYFIRRKTITIIIAIAGIFLLILMSKVLPKQKLPDFNQAEALIEIDWQDQINLQENQRRVDSLFAHNPNLETYIAWNGQQNYLLRNDNEKGQEQTKLYVKATGSTALKKLIKNFKREIKTFQKVKYHISPPENLFQYIFEDNTAYLNVEVFKTGHQRLPEIDSLSVLQQKFGLPVEQIELKKALQINVSSEKLALYNVNYQNLIDKLQAAFQNHYIDHLKTRQKFYPIVLSYPKQSIQQILNNLFVENRNRQLIPVNSLVQLQPVAKYKFIHGDKNNEYLRFVYPKFKNTDTIINRLKQLVQNDPTYNIRFSGSYFSQKQSFKELMIVMLISLLLLYFIMVAQFESFWQPLIILLEIPIDIGFGLLFLFLFGSSINIMALIGIVVMSGIVINDSILKLYTINMLLKQGYDVDEAIKEAGRMRFKAILMTSLTTVLALLPFLFMQGLGAELQKPLALTVIGSMIFGTFVSLYFLPMAYKWFYTKFLTKK